MRILRRLFHLATGRPSVATDVDDEIEVHLALAEDELVDQGVPAHEARRRVETAFGDRDRLSRTLRAIDQSQYQANRRGEAMDKWRSDFRLALRGLSRDRWFTTSACGLIALALGANIAVFSVFNAAFFQRLPYPAADRLVTVSETKRGNHNRVAGLNFLDWQRLSRDFTQLAAYGLGDAAVLIGGLPEVKTAGVVSHSFAEVMGMVPIAGRWFSLEESRVGAPPTVVLSERMWRLRFGADLAAIGATIRVDGAPTTVVGVMPAGLDFPVGADFWTPAEPVHATPNRTAHNWNVVGRLAPGVGISAAQGRLSLLTQQLVASEPSGNSEFLADGAAVIPFRATLLGQSDRLLTLLQLAVGLLLVIAVLNLTALLLARAAKRQPEVAMVVTLGASWQDLARWFVIESLILAGVGSSVGLLAWMIGRPVLLAAIASLLPFVHTIPIDFRLGGAIVAATLLVGIGAGLLPALWVARAVDLGRTQRPSTRVIGPGRLMQALLAAEVATAFVLLFAASLLSQSLSRMLDQPLGFATENRVTMSVSLPTAEGSPYLTADRHIAFFDQLLERVSQIPGVANVAVTTSLPLRDYTPNGSARIQGESSDLGGPAAVSDFRIVAPKFFATMGIPIVRGRAFTPQDGAGSPYVVVVSEAFSKTHLRGVNPVGRLVRFPGMDNLDEDRWATIVGVVADTRHGGPGDPVAPTIYYSYRQRPQLYRTMTVVVQVTGPAGPVEEEMKRALATLEPTVPYLGGPMSSALAGVLEGPRVRALIIGAFAGAALATAGLGLFGIVGFVVLRRTRELGVRIALGAPNGSVVATAAGHAAWPVAIGILSGAVIAASLTRLVRGFLFELSPADPTAFVMATAAIALVATLATIGPVRRALAIDPMTALRG